MGWFFPFSVLLVAVWLLWLVVVVGIVVGALVFFVCIAVALGGLLRGFPGVKSSVDGVHFSDYHLAQSGHGILHLGCHGC